MENFKKWFTSKTVWFNLIAGIVAISTYLMDLGLTAKQLEILGAVVAIGNILLRFNTSKPIGKSKP